MLIKIAKKVFNSFRLKRVIANLNKNALILGDNHRFSLTSRISLKDGALKGNVVIAENAWFEGRICVQNKGKVSVGSYSHICNHSLIYCVDSVVIGDHTIIANNTIVCDNNNHPISPSFRHKMGESAPDSPMHYWKYSDSAPIVIGSNCWIGSHVRICKGVTIGDNSVIGACSVVTKDIPANCVAVGNPARVVKTDIDKIQEPTYP